MELHSCETREDCEVTIQSTFPLTISICYREAPYETIRDHKGPYGTILDHTEPYGAIWDHTGSYESIQDHIGP